MRAHEIFEAEPDYRFLGQRFEQRLDDIWNLAPDDPKTALRLARRMQSWLQGHQRLPMTDEQLVQHRYLLRELHNFVSFMQS